MEPGQSKYAGKPGYICISGHSVPECQQALVLFRHTHALVQLLFVWKSSVARSYAASGILVTR